MTEQQKGERCENCHYSIHHTDPSRNRLNVVCTNPTTQFTKFRDSVEGGKEVSRHDWCASYLKAMGSN